MRFSKLNVTKVVLVAIFAISFLTVNTSLPLINNRVVEAATITLNPTSLPPGGTLLPYPTQTITASGGTAPYRFAVTSGSLPPGLGLASGGGDLTTWSAGILSGTPTSTGNYTFTVTATDATNATGAQQYSMTIAPPITVNTGGDPMSGNPYTCPTACTLRDAVAKAQFVGYGSVINFAITQGSGCQGYAFCIYLNSPLDITANSNGGLSIIAPAGGNYMLISGGTDQHPTYGTQIFTNELNSTLYLTNLTIADGLTSAVLPDGGNILNFGTLTIDHSIIENGKAESSNTQLYHGLQPGLGGGIFNEGTLTIRDQSQLVGNVSDGSTGFPGSQTGYGGGVFSKGDLTIDNSSFISNMAADGPPPNFGAVGGAIATYGNAPTQITDSTFESNQADFGGGLLISGGSIAKISGSTIEGNTANRMGGGIYSYAGGNTRPLLSNDTIYQNIAAQDAGGIMADNGSGAAIISSTLANNGVKLSLHIPNAGNSIDRLSPNALYIIEGTIISDFEQTAGVNNCGTVGTQIGTNSFKNWQEDQTGSFVDDSCNFKASWGTNGPPVWPSPVLLPLASIGGLPSTAVINTSNDTAQSFSPLIDTVTNCPTSVDQTGLIRPDNVAGFPNNSNCDIGAVEAGSVTARQYAQVNVLDDLDLGKCTFGVSNAHCSLREAIKYSPWGSTITFAPGLTGAIYLTGGVLNIPNEALTITGPTTAPGITIDGQNATSLFYVPGLGVNTVTFNNLTFAHGSGYYGGAFYFFGPGTLNFNNDLFAGNYTSQPGGAIQCDCANAGTRVNVANSTFYNNAAGTTGGAINNLAGFITIVDSGCIRIWGRRLGGEPELVKSVIEDGGADDNDAFSARARPAHS
ncbi:MAG: putative Ig domain-containing protein, partial [Aggregatilineales bacterium]